MECLDLKEQIFIGIDPSSTNTGVVILSASGELKDYVLVSPNKTLNFDERVVYILKVLFEIFNKYNNDAEIFVSMEGPALYGKGKRSELAMLAGAIYYFLKYNGVPIVIVPPSKLKKFATGNGRASKEEMGEAAPKKILQRFSKEFKKHDDLIDAYFLARSCLETFSLN